MQQESIKEWFQKLLKIRVTNCLTKVYGNNSLLKVMSKYIEANGEQNFMVN